MSFSTEESAIKYASEAVISERARKKAAEEKKSAINELKEKLKSLKLNEETLSKAIEKVSDDGSNYEEVIKETKKECVEEIKKRIETCTTLKDEEKSSFVSRILNDGSNLNEIYEEAAELANSRFEKKRQAKKQIRNTGLSKERKDALEKEINTDGSNCDEIVRMAKTEDTSKPGTDEATGTSLPRPKAEELKVEVKEGNIIYVENNKKIKMERRTVAIGDISDISERNIVVGGKEVFLYEYEKKKEGEIEIRGYGEYGILPKLKSNNERVLARLYDRVLEGRERKEEGEVEGKGVGKDKGSQLFEKIGHLRVADAYAYVSKEVRGLSLIPNIVMSVGSEEERKYVYKNMGERGEGEENKIWIEGINEVKNYGEDENSVGKYSDNKVGTIIGYGREVGEGKYVGMYMKGSKHEIKQGAGNSGEVVNVGLGISGKYENKVEIKWLTYVGMNKCRTEIGWEEGNVKGEFSMGEVGIDVEGGLKIRSELIGIVKPYKG
jgi:hypothetical protein